MTSQNPTLLLIHGAGASAAVWPEQLLSIPGVRSVAIDLPGHGKSAAPGRRTIGHYADAVAEQIHAEVWPDLFIAGHSMGGAIAMELARRNLRGLRGIILLAAAARLRVGPTLFAGLSNDFAATAEMISNLSFAPDAPQALRDANTATILRCGQPITTGDFLACNGFDLTADLPNLSLPTLMISGTADRMVPHRQSARAAAAMPNTTFHALEGIGHTVMQEAPQAVAALISQFLHEIQ